VPPSLYRLFSIEIRLFSIEIKLNLTGTYRSPIVAEKRCNDFRNAVNDRSNTPRRHAQTAPGACRTSAEPQANRSRRRAPGACSRCSPRKRASSRLAETYCRGPCQQCGHTSTKSGTGGRRTLEAPKRALHWWVSLPLRIHQTPRCLGAEEPWLRDGQIWAKSGLYGV
jgi:hypothetical protein